ncbi:MAG TPA: sigma-70 family RNA polymerase sigma factor, partial [Ignavibacteria bacterium]|nr:sigma-70 family RNA polymerase sigma factor [Ignavibacteria bacterium]
IFSQNSKALSKQQVESCMNDLELNIIRKIQAGNIGEFEEIVNRYKDKAMTLAMRILKNTEDAEDALQEAFIKTFRAIADKQFEERSKFSTYFYRIVYNTAIDFYKKHRSKTYNLINIDEKSVNEEGEVTDITAFELKIDNNNYQSSRVFDTEWLAAEGELQDTINRYLEQIPEKYSTILTLFYVNDLSHEEISETLKLPLGTVKNRIFRAKDKLKEIMLQNHSESELLEMA